MRSLTWIEPRWSWVPQYRAELRETGLLTLRLWVRIYAVVAVILGAMLLGATRFQPGFQIPPQVYIAPLAIPPVVLLKPVLLLVIPRRVKVSARRIVLSHGDSAKVIERERILFADLDASDPQRIRWTIAYRTRRGREGRACIGVPPTVSLVELDEAMNGLSIELNAPTPA